MSGYYVQSFAFIGRGRRAFPVKGYVKIDKTPIMSKQVEEADFTMLLDPTIDLDVKNMKEKSVVILNSSEKLASPQLKKRKVKVYFVDATEIALTHLKSNTPNTAMLGALAKAFPKISMKAIKTSMEGMPKENIVAFDEGYKGAK